MINYDKQAMCCVCVVMCHTHLGQRALFLTHLIAFPAKQTQEKHPSFRVKQSRKSTGDSLLLTHVGRPPWDLIRGKVLFCFDLFFLILIFLIYCIATLI